MWTRRALGVVHVVWGICLLAVATWLAVSTFRVSPKMSTGSILALQMSLPPATLGVWMIVLGRRLWSRHPALRSTLRRTHIPLFALGVIAVWIGVVAVRAAARSAARGGGLLGGVAYLPLVFGIPVTILAVCSLGVASREPRP